MYRASRLAAAFWWEGIERASEAAAEVEDDVGVEHGGAEVFVAEESLDGSDVDAVFEEVGCE